MITYAQRMKTHLSRYRTQRLGLGIDEQGTWSGNGQNYSHILPGALERLNILETIRSEFWQYPGSQSIKLHKDFAHLNSSQALAFNLFFPFFGLKGAQPDSLLRALKLPIQEVRDWGFERVLDATEGTNFDFYLEGSSGLQAVIEVKLTETEFGAGVPNQNRREKLREIYVPNLQGKVCPEVLEEKAFFADYQLLRNISYADSSKRHHVVFLLPRANAGLAAAAETFLKSALLPPIEPFVSLLYLEDVLHSLSIMALSPLLATHLSLLQEKYTWEHQPEHNAKPHNIAAPTRGTIRNCRFQRSKGHAFAVTLATIVCRTWNLCAPFRLA